MRRGMNLLVRTAIAAAGALVSFGPLLAGQVNAEDDISFCSSEISDGSEHTVHDAVKVYTKAATSDMDGHKRYWKCDGCGKLFADAECTEEVTMEDLVIPAYGDGVPITATYFPDESMRETLSRQFYDKNRNGVLDPDEIQLITGLGADSRMFWECEDFRGLEYLTEVSSVGSWESGKYFRYDFGECPKVKSLEFEMTNIKLLEIERPGELEKLSIWESSLKELRIEEPTKVKELYLAQSISGTFDLSYFPLVEYLNFCDNTVTELDLSPCPNLKVLKCSSYWSLLETLDISENPYLIMAYQKGELSETNYSYCTVYTYTYTDGDETYELSVDSRTKIIAPKSGWVTEDGKTYYYDENNEVVTGWVYLNNWYFFDENGVMQTGWVYQGNKWYFMDAEGVMQTGWLAQGSKWYFLGRGGAMQTGWLAQGNKWYYFGSNGVMQTGWQAINGQWYFFKSNGAMAANEYCQGYWLNSNGTWTYKKKASWRKSKAGWWYSDGTWYAKNGSWIIDGVRYTFDARGYMVVK